MTFQQFRPAQKTIVLQQIPLIPPARDPLAFDPREQSKQPSTFTQWIPSLESIEKQVVEQLNQQVDESFRPYPRASSKTDLEKFEDEVIDLNDNIFRQKPDPVAPFQYQQISFVQRLVNDITQYFTDYVVKKVVAVNTSLQFEQHDDPFTEPNRGTLGHPKNNNQVVHNDSNQQVDVNCLNDERYATSPLAWEGTLNLQVKWSENIGIAQIQNVVRQIVIVPKGIFNLTLKELCQMSDTSFSKNPHENIWNLLQSLSSSNNCPFTYEQTLAVLFTVKVAIQFSADMRQQNKGQQHYNNRRDENIMHRLYARFYKYRAVQAFWIKIIMLVIAIASCPLVMFLAWAPVKIVNYVKNNYNVYRFAGMGRNKYQGLAFISHNRDETSTAIKINGTFFRLFACNFFQETPARAGGQSNVMTIADFNLYFVVLFLICGDYRLNAIVSLTVQLVLCDSASMIYMFFMISGTLSKFVLSWSVAVFGVCFVIGDYLWLVDIFSFFSNQITFLFQSGSVYYIIYKNYPLVMIVGVARIYASAMLTDWRHVDMISHAMFAVQCYNMHEYGWLVAPIVWIITLLADNWAKLGNRRIMGGSYKHINLHQNDFQRFKTIGPALQDCKYYPTKNHPVAYGSDIMIEDLQKRCTCSSNQIGRTWRQTGPSDKNVFLYDENCPVSRMGALHRSLTPQQGADPILVREFDEYVAANIATFTQITPDSFSFQEFLEQADPSQKATYIKGIAAFDEIWNFFAPYQFNPKNNQLNKLQDIDDIKERNIGVPTPQKKGYPCWYNSFCLISVKQSLERTRDGFKKAFVHGLNCHDLGDDLSKKWKSVPNCVAICIDGSGHDSRQKAILKNIVDNRFHDIMVRKFMKVTGVCGLIARQMKLFFQSPTNKFIIQDHQHALMCKGTINGTVFSGDPVSTTLGNTLRVILYAGFILHQAELRAGCKIQHKISVAGDDCLIFIDRQYLDCVISCTDSVYTVQNQNGGLGQVATQIFIAQQWHKIDFLSKSFWGDQYHYEVTRNPYQFRWSSSFTDSRITDEEHSSAVDTGASVWAHACQISQSYWDSRDQKFGYEFKERKYFEQSEVDNLYALQLKNLKSDNEYVTPFRQRIVELREDYRPINKVKYNPCVGHLNRYWPSQRARPINSNVQRSAPEVRSGTTPSIIRVSDASHAEYSQIEQTKLIKQMMPVAKNQNLKKRNNKSSNQPSTKKQIKKISQKEKKLKKQVTTLQKQIVAQNKRNTRNSVPRPLVSQLQNGTQSYIHSLLNPFLLNSRMPRQFFAQTLKINSGVQTFNVTVPAGQQMFIYSCPRIPLMNVAGSTMTRGALEFFVIVGQNVGSSMFQNLTSAGLSAGLYQTTNTAYVVPPSYWGYVSRNYGTAQITGTIQEPKQDQLALFPLESFSQWAVTSAGFEVTNTTNVLNRGGMFDACYNEGKVNTGIDVATKNFPQTTTQAIGSARHRLLGIDAAKTSVIQTRFFPHAISDQDFNELALEDDSMPSGSGQILLRYYGSSVAQTFSIRYLCNMEVIPNAQGLQIYRDNIEACPVSNTPAAVLSNAIFKKQGWISLQKN